MQTSTAALFAELLNHGYRIHPLPQGAIAWERQVTLDDVAGLGAGAFINLVAVPPAKARKASTLRVPISTG